MSIRLKYLIKNCIYLVLVIAVFNLACDRQNKKQMPVLAIPLVKEADLLNNPGFISGRSLFSENCSACHSINRTDAHLLDDIRNYIDNEKLLYGLIRNNDSVVQHNQYFNERFKIYGVHMPAFPQFTVEEIDQLIRYLKIEFILKEEKQKKLLH